MLRSLPLSCAALAAILVGACSSPSTGHGHQAQQGSPNSDPHRDAGDAGLGQDPTDDPATEQASDDAATIGDVGGAGGDTGSPGSDAGGDAAPTSDCVYNPGSTTTTPSGWRAVAPISTIGHTAPWPMSGRWTGHELLFFGDGLAASYQPSTNVWKALPPAPIGFRYSGPVVELAGSTKLIVWGGSSATEVFTRDGAVFDLCTGTWTRIPDAPIIGRARVQHVYATTTKELIVWGGDRFNKTPPGSPADWPLGEQHDGAAYSLATGTWRMIADATPTIPATDGESYSAYYGYAWTGTQMMIYGGGPNHSGPPSSNVAAAYNPMSNTWQLLPSPAIQARQFGWQREVSPLGATSATFFGGVSLGFPERRPGDGATFDFATSTWTTIPLPDAAALPDAHRTGTANAWIGDRFYVWGGAGSDASVDSSGAVFDPATRTWSSMPSGGPHAAGYSENIGSPMNGEALFWAETMMIYRP